MAKILIVEDDRHINELIRRNLKLAGHECVCCFDGIQAQEMISERQYDLILLDVMLSGMSGFELIRKFRLGYRAKTEKGSFRFRGCCMKIMGVIIFNMKKYYQIWIQLGDSFRKNICWSA